jgi:hypothetical protein
VLNSIKEGNGSTSDLNLLRDVKDLSWLSAAEMTNLVDGSPWVISKGMKLFLVNSTRHRSLHTPKRRCQYQLSERQKRAGNCGFDSARSDPGLPLSAEQPMALSVRGLQ